MDKETIYGIMIIFGLLIVGMAMGIVIQPIFDYYIVVLAIGGTLLIIGTVSLMATELMKPKIDEYAGEDNDKLQD